jgi:3-dehydroquinate dehydratase-2
MISPIAGFSLRPMTSVFLCIGLTLILGIRSGGAEVQSDQPQPRLKILVIHGPNMNLLGRREPAIYGTMTLAEINQRLEQLAKELNVELIVVQSNHEGVLIDTFQAHMDDADGAIINAAGDSMHGVALHDVIKAMPFPTIEVHMSNLGTRDEIHRNSVITAAARGTVMGLGWRSYTMALRAVVEIAREEKSKAK